MALDSDQSRDGDLILRIRQGDKEALDSLFRAYWVRLNRYARTIAMSDDLAQDVVQEVFFKLWRGRKSLDISGTVSFYLYRAVRNQALSTISADRSSVFRDARWIAGNTGGHQSVSVNEAETALSSADILNLVTHELRTLPPRCQEIFLLSWQHNMSYDQISNLLGISIPTIRNQMSRAVTHLATAIRPQDIISGSFLTFKLKSKRSSEIN